MIRLIWNFLLDHPITGLVLCILAVAVLEAFP